MSKILITAFEPFGPIRGLVFKKNASLEVLEQIGANDLQNRFEYLVLPVSDDGEKMFADALESARPAGIVSMGEYLFQSPTNIKVEPCALRAPLSSLPRLGRGAEVFSPFAEKIGHGEARERASIGLYYCNRIYIRGLDWAHKNGGRPSVFLHIPVFGDRKAHYHQTMAIVEQMEQR